MKTFTLAQAGAHIERILDEVATSSQAVRIRGKRSSAVLVSADDWRSIQETLYLSTIPGFTAAVKDGMAEPLHQSIRP